MWLGHIICRKGILDPKKLPVMDVIDFAAMSDTNDLPVASPATGQTKSGFTSFKNDLTNRYGSKYRDPDNSELLMGELMSLGKAFGILAICMFGPTCRLKSTGMRIDCRFGRMLPSTPGP